MGRAQIERNSDSRFCYWARSRCGIRFSNSMDREMSMAACSISWSAVSRSLAASLRSCSGVGSLSCTQPIVAQDTAELNLYRSHRVLSSGAFVDKIAPCPES